jgi:hypothetical protein
MGTNQGALTVIPNYI